MGDSSHAFKTGFLNDIRSLKTTETIFGFYNDGADLVLCSYGYNNGRFSLRCYDGTNRYTLQGNSNGTLTWNSKNVAMYEDVIPRSGGAVITGGRLASTNDDWELRYDGGTDWDRGSSLVVMGKNHPYKGGRIFFHASIGSLYKSMWLHPDGTWTWDGTACQITSDQRLKQQISEIDDKLLDAWEDVELSQFKYNDAVETKGKDKARLHTGYVVQQIDDACKKHNVDVSKYGLYCHEEYPERTEEVTIENEDGTTSKETKVIEPAREYYSLRYTETLVVECAYLRRENDKLKQQFKQLEETVNELKSIINYSEIPNS